jgi:hypothetical protein
MSLIKSGRVCIPHSLALVLYCELISHSRVSLTKPMAIDLDKHTIVISVSEDRDDEGGFA